VFGGRGSWIAHSDIRQVRALASIVCTLFGVAEAKALIVQHRAAILAIAGALMVEKTFNAEQIDSIIAAAPERARRADWAKVIEARLILPPDDVCSWAQSGSHLLH
jgi:hypothetical protein